LGKIVSFYKNEKVHPYGYQLEEMWAWDDKRIETLHSFIQWMFPLDEPSANNLHAPVLSDEEIAQLGSPIKKNGLNTYARIIHV